MPTDKPRQLEPGFEQEYATRLVGVDTLWGGNIGVPSGRDHFIADSWPRGEVELPDIYGDPRSEALRKSGGVTPDSGELVRGYMSQYGLLDKGRLAESLGPGESQLRRRFVGNMERALDVMARAALAVAENRPLPPHEELFEAAVFRSPELIDPTELREKLRLALSKVGIEVTDRKTLNDAVAEWEKRVGFVEPVDFAKEVAKTNAELLRLTRKNIFGAVDFSADGYDPHLADVLFDGLRFETVTGVTFTGSSAYEGGLKPDGTPALSGLIEYNTEHPITRAGLPHYCSHEIIPGHYADSAVSDLGYRSGRLPFEASAHTMCTGETALRERWAQNALAMSHGGSEDAVVEALGPDQAIQYLLEHLQDVGKTNAPILFQGQHVSPDDIAKHLSVDCVLPGPIVKKLVAWAQHPILGLMYGSEYAAGYSDVKEAIKKHGPRKVAEAALHRHGYLDLDTFQVALNQGL